MTCAPCAAQDDPNLSLSDGGNVDAASITLGEEEGGTPGAFGADSIGVRPRETGMMEQAGLTVVGESLWLALDVQGSTQSSESSISRTKVGKVRKHPIKEHPWPWRRCERTGRRVISRSGT
jgi:hypothetical protein